MTASTTSSSAPKVVLLAGGMGTRLTEETAYGMKEFVVALGYKGEAIKRYFLDYYAIHGNMRVSLRDGDVKVDEQGAEDWVVNLIDTGLEVMTGGRLKRLEPLLKDGTFCLTYGDGVADIDLDAVVACHKKHRRIATITAVRPPARFGGLIFDGDNCVKEFTEKPQIGEGWINGGFMVFEPAVFRYLENDDTILEAHVLERLAEEGQLTAYKHDRFWQCMDTMRDVKVLESLWQSGEPPWRPASATSSPPPSKRLNNK